MKNNEKIFDELLFKFENRIKNKETCLEIIKQYANYISSEVLFNNINNQTENNFNILFATESNMFAKKIDMVDVSNKDSIIIPMVTNVEEILNNGLKINLYQIFKDKGFIQSEEKWQTMGFKDDFGDKIIGSYLPEVNISFIWSGGDKIAIANILEKTRLRNNKDYHSFFPTEKFLKSTITSEYIIISNKKIKFNVNILILLNLIKRYYLF